MDFRWVNTSALSLVHRKLIALIKAKLNGRIFAGVIALIRLICVVAHSRSHFKKIGAYQANYKSSKACSKR